MGSKMYFSGRITGPWGVTVPDPIEKSGKGLSAVPHPISTQCDIPL